MYYNDYLLRISGTEPQSIVDGPGIRYVIFTQGCERDCYGCHNPQTHDILGGRLVNIDKLYNDIIRDPLIQGITFSGGEPLLQIIPLLNLTRKLKRKNYHIICYTGFLFEQIKNNINYCDLLNNIDILIDGPFIENLKNIDLKYRGSSNQRIIDIKETIKNNKIITLEDIVL